MDTILLYNRLHWLVFGLLLLLLTLLPLFTSPTYLASPKARLAAVTVVTGVFLILGGILDHLLLARTLTPAPDGEYEDA